MSRPIPRAILLRQLDEAMRNDNKRRISSIMKQLQNLNQPQRNPRVGTPIKIPKGRRTPIPMPMPPRRRRRGDPRRGTPVSFPIRLPRGSRFGPAAGQPIPTRTTPRRKPPTANPLRNAAEVLRKRFRAAQDPKTRGQLSQISEAQRRALMLRGQRQQTTPRRLTKRQQEAQRFSQRRDARMKNIRDRMMKRGRSQKDIQRRLFNVDMAFQRRGFNKFGNPQERAAFDLQQKRSREMFDLVQRGGTQREQFELQKKYQDLMKKGAAPKKRTTVQRQPSIVRSSKGTLVKKNSIGVNDFRKGGLTLSVTDNKKKKK